jgi:type IV pilus assembly protein PilX
MVIVMVALMVLLAGGVTLIRSSDANSSLAGQLAFRRDLKNQGERGIAWAIAQFSTGSLSTYTSRQANVVSINYSATRLAANTQGIPNALLTDSAFTAAGMTGTDITSTATGVTIRTVIDRLCTSTGAHTASTCTILSLPCAKNTSSQDSATAQNLDCQLTAYRISVRVDGPRSTQAFFQSIVGI